MHTAIGVTRPTTAGSGDRMRAPLTSTLIGRHIDMVTGYGVRRMVGPGWAMNPGDGRHITTDDGCITTVTGRGVLGVHTSDITAGGDPRL